MADKGEKTLFDNSGTTAFCHAEGPQPYRQGSGQNGYNKNLFSKYKLAIE